MPKPKRLIDALRAEPIAVKSGPDNWADKLRRKNPELMADVDEIIDTWNRDDSELLGKCPTKHALASWLVPRLEGIVTKPDTVSRYIRARAERGNQG